MNRIFAVALVLLLVASSAYAVDMETEGMYYVRGSIISNETGLSADNTASYGYYDQELDMTVGLKVSDYTKVTVNFEIRDQNWTESDQDDSVVTDGAGLDDTIEFKRVFGQHTFATGTTVLAGLQTGGAWASSFADNATGNWKLQVMQQTPVGTIGGILEKDYEAGAADPTTEDAEKDDGDTYYIFGIFPVGSHKIMPLIKYQNLSHTTLPYAGTTINQQDGDGVQVMVFDLGAAGAAGSLGYEAEVVYADLNKEDLGGEKYSLYGAYANVWMTMGATKVGGQLAYGSWDEDGMDGFGFGEDYTPTMFGADWTNVGTQDSYARSEYSAVTLGQVYAEFALSEALSLGANATYWVSNETETVWEDANGYEIDLTADYKITENVTYGVLLAYGQWTQDDGATGVDEDGNTVTGVDDADAFYRLYHKFTINF